MSNIIVTGATGGIGLEVAKQLISEGHNVLMACRNEEKAKSIIKNLEYKIKPRIGIIDLSDMKSIINFTDKLADSDYKIDVLINNAGVYCGKRELTSDGLEMTMGVNYYGTVLLTERLLPLMNKDSRIIFVTSKAGFSGKLPFGNEDFKKGFQGFKAYAASKLAGMIYARMLAERVKGRIIVNSAHPGLVATGIWSKSPKWMSFIMTKISASPANGAKSTHHLSVADMNMTDTDGYYNEKAEREEWIEKVSDAASSVKWMNGTYEIIRKYLDIGKNEFMGEMPL